MVGKDDHCEESDQHCDSHQRCKINERWELKLLLLCKSESRPDRPAKQAQRRSPLLLLRPLG